MKKKFKGNKGSVSSTKKLLNKAIKKDKIRRVKGNDVVKKSLEPVKEIATVVKIKKNAMYNGEKSRPMVSNMFPGRAPVPEEKLQKHSRGVGLDEDGIKTNFFKKKLKKREKIIAFSTEQAARTEILLPEESGFLVADEGETTTQFTQKQIADSVDITSATKYFELQLNDFGPYRMNYSRNGRCLLLGGRRGHVAAFDWVTKKLFCEMNVMEEVFDVQWLHVNTMFAVAQKEWVYIYDHEGIELHCIKRLDRVLRMEFLPYHFLLATANDKGYLSWLDISIGKIISQFNSRMGRLNIMTQNPYNAVLCLGHSKGIVTMWSPNVNNPLAKMLCHPRPITALAIDPTGKYMATSGMDRSLKIWDVRKLEGPLQHYQLSSSMSHLAFSQRNVLATGVGNIVEVYKDACTTSAARPYMRHKLWKNIGNMEFCPYEDVLGVGTSGGFTSLIIPGSGEPNFDALESNPYQTKSQRKESEVKALLEKIPPELITLDPYAVAEVDIPTLKDKIEAKKKLLHLKPPKIDFTPRSTSGRRRGTAKIVKTKNILREQGRKEFIKSVKNVQSELEEKSDAIPAANPVPPKPKPKDVLDRFKPKTKR
ncbi:WD repeat-containing protein 46 [Anabrus simplex]|uniref:WD repeat-containing protein 46 n=1 Tax=Anabrus simplex TaxID=316456 RepID=UPI0035A38A20